jgi:hypothetical protein
MFLLRLWRGALSSTLIVRVALPMRAPAGVQRCAFGEEAQSGISRMHRPAEGTLLSAKMIIRGIVSNADSHFEPKRHSHIPGFVSVR